MSQRSAEIGDVFEGRAYTVTASALKVVAALLRDPNPIHFDHAAAASAGRGTRLVAQGPVTAAVAYEALLEHCAGGRLMTSQLQYAANAVEGDILTARSVVTGREESGVAVVWTVALTVSDGRGEVKARGTASVVVP